MTTAGDQPLASPVDCTEKGSVAVITLNRPERLNTLTEAMIAGVADGIDAATAHRIGLVSHVCPPEELSGAVEAYARRFEHIPANQLALNKLLINQAFENMGLRTTQLLGTLFDGMTRHTEEAYRWVESFETKGFRQVIAERDAPFGDYGAASER